MCDLIFPFMCDFIFKVLSSKIIFFRYDTKYLIFIIDNILNNIHRLERSYLDGF